MVHSQGGRCLLIHPSVRPLDVDLYLRNVSFDGIMGKFQFDKSGDPVTSSYGIINFHGAKKEGLHKISSKLLDLGIRIPE